MCHRCDSEGAIADPLARRAVGVLDHADHVVRRVGDPRAVGEAEISTAPRVGSVANAKATIGRPELRIHDLRHTAASVWLASGADPKMFQRVLGHATAAMTMDPARAHDRPQPVGRGPAAGGTAGTRRDDGRDDEGGALAKVAID